MIGALIGSLAGQALGGLANYLIHKKTIPKAFKNTEYGKYLQDIAEKGAISGAQRANLIGKSAQAAYNQAGINDAKLQGNLINSGMENSIAGNRARNEIRTNAANQVSEATKDIDMANEQSKQDAMALYQQLAAQREEEIRRHKANMLGGVANTVTNMANTGLGYLGNMYDIRANANMLQNVMNNMGNIDITTPQGKLQLLQQILKGGGDFNQFMALRDMYAKGGG